MKNKNIYRNEIKSYIIRAGMTMSEVVEILADEYGWSSSVPNLSDKLKRGSLRYGEAVEPVSYTHLEVYKRQPCWCPKYPSRRPTTAPGRWNGRSTAPSM